MPQSTASKKTERAKMPMYSAGTGRRKTAVARVRIVKSAHPQLIVNEQDFRTYFQDALYEKKALESLAKLNLNQGFSVSAVVRGGGKHAQAEAVRHGVARALIEHDPELRPHLKALGYLTRDPRMKERKKFGLKKARRARQWRKR